MTSTPPPDDHAVEAFWRDYLTRGNSKERRIRNVLKHIPQGPRCRLCAAPFGGAGGSIMRLVGKRPAGQNPRVCSSCFSFISTHHGGAEIECTMLFADIRGSTTIAEAMSATDYRRLLDRFYTVASSVVFEHQGTVDKFVGDELMAIFFPLFSSDRHAIGGVGAAMDLLRATGHADPDGPWVPVGAGVHTATTWFGAVGEGSHVELTALGDAVNVAARLASNAAAGEILVTSDAAAAAGLDPALVRRSLDLKGKSVATEVVSLTVSA
ncbi:MAG TPA: adenylate/guanylate cyclase domain-containing protein [Candidatus Limnocylindrales bacterium]|nr:adenylate/guanylate cyclase domain-containing protein [Candidatus Limnocylindrales bacterium]